MTSSLPLPLIVRDLTADDLPLCDWAGSGAGAGWVGSASRYDTMIILMNKTLEPRSGTDTGPV